MLSMGAFYQVIMIKMGGCKDETVAASLKLLTWCQFGWFESFEQIWFLGLITAYVLFEIVLMEAICQVKDLFKMLVK